MKIYDRPGFPNPARIRIVLAEKGLDDQVEFVSVDLMAAEHKQPAFLAKNPAGIVPVLELDDGTLISESTAITEYLDNLDGRPSLTGRTPQGEGADPHDAAARRVLRARSRRPLLPPRDAWPRRGLAGLQEPRLVGPQGNGPAGGPKGGAGPTGISTTCSSTARSWPAIRYHGNRQRAQYGGEDDVDEEEHPELFSVARVLEVDVLLHYCHVPIHVVSSCIYPGCSAGTAAGVPLPSQDSPDSRIQEKPGS